MTLPSQAKALLALIIGISVIIPAAAMISGNSFLPSLNQPAATSNASPSDQSSPTNQNKEETRDSSSSENQDASNPSSDSSQPENALLPSIKTDIFTKEGSHIATVTGYWGADLIPEPIGTLTGEILTLSTSNDDDPTPWLSIRGPYQGNEIQMRIPLESTTFQGFITATQNIGNINTINGLSWQNSQGTGFIIIFFQWQKNRYWLIIQSPNSYGISLIKTEKPVAFEGYWGIDQIPNPNGPLTGEVLAMSSSRTNGVITPWLSLNGPYQNNQINIKIPLDQTPFQGFLWLQGSWGDAQDITGSYWHEIRTPGLFLSFFSWNANKYWIIGISNDF